METFLLNARRGSAGGSALARAMNIKKLTKQRLAEFIPGAGKTVVNWGNSEVPEKVSRCRVLNNPSAVNASVNKLTAFVEMEKAGVNVPQFTQSAGLAFDWLENGNTVVARHILRGSGGAGIQILRTLNEWDDAIDAPLYVTYIPKKSEYRVHILGGKVFDVQQKLRKRDFPDEDVNWQIRNHANGFIYGRQIDIIGPHKWDKIHHEAVAAVSALGLDFGAVDIIWNDKFSEAFVLEVNTAPGLEGETVGNYAMAFHDFINGVVIRNPRKLAKVNFNDIAERIAMPAAKYFDAGLDEELNVIRNNGI